MGSTGARGFFVRGDVFRQSTSDGSTQRSPPNLENGTYVRQQQQIGEIYTKHGNMEQQRQIGETYNDKERYH